MGGDEGYVNKDKKSGIGKFFKKLTKSEYQKQMEQNLEQPVIVTTKAQVHSPLSEREITNNFDRQSAKKKERRCSKEHVEHLNQIEVLEVIEERTMDQNEHEKSWGQRSNRALVDQNLGHTEPGTSFEGDRDQPGISSKGDNDQQPEASPTSEHSDDHPGTSPKSSDDQDQANGTKHQSGASSKGDSDQPLTSPKSFDDQDQANGTKHQSGASSKGDSDQPGTSSKSFDDQDQANGTKLQPGASSGHSDDQPGTSPRSSDDQDQANGTKHQPGTSSGHSDDQPGTSPKSSDDQDHANSAEHQSGTSPRSSEDQDQTNGTKHQTGIGSKGDSDQPGTSPKSFDDQDQANSAEYQSETSARSSDAKHQANSTQTQSNPQSNPPVSPKSVPFQTSKVNEKPSEKNLLSTKDREIDKDNEQVTDTTKNGNRRYSLRISNRNSSQALKRQLEAESELDERLSDLDTKSPAKRRQKRGKVDKGNKMGNRKRQVPERDNEVIVEKEILPSKNKKPLAPIFMQKKAAKVVVEDPAKVAARKAFLHSSIPEAFKKIRQHDVEERVPGHHGFMAFSSIGHIRQWDKEERDQLVSLAECKTSLGIVEKDPLASGPLSKVGFDISVLGILEAAKMGLNLETPRVGNPRHGSWMSSAQIFHFVKSLKMMNDDFPINKIFRRFLERRMQWDSLEAEALKKNLSLNQIEDEMSVRRLRRRKVKLGLKKPDKKKSKKMPEEQEEVDYKFDPGFKSSMLWTMKYAPQESEDIIGNFKVVKALHSWLQDWKYKNKKKDKRKDNVGKKRKDSFIVSSSDEDSFFSDTDSEDDSMNLCNTALLSGPSGIGKTCTVYALAKQLGFKVLEVNASSVRSRKQVMAQLQEATQSHHVSKQERQKNFLQPAGKKERHLLNKTALILFEDVDLVFDEQDEGFYSAVNSLISATKRPIILTTSNLNFYPKKVLKTWESLEHFVFKSVPIKTSAQYLQLLCLSEGFPVSLPAVEKLIELNNGVISQSIQDLQLWSQSSEPLECQIDGNEICQDGDRRRNRFFNLDDSYQGNLTNASTDLEDQETEKQSTEFVAIAKLLFGKPKTDDEGPESSVAPVKPMQGCAESKLGLRPSNLFKDARSLFCFHSQIQHYWPHCLGEYYEWKKYSILEVPGGSNALSCTDKFSQWLKNKQKYKRIKFDMSIFTTDASMEEEEKTDLQADIRPKIPQTDEEKANFRRNSHHIDQISKCAEISSLFLPFSDGQYWWALKQSELALDTDSVSDQVTSYLHCQTLKLASQNIASHRGETEITSGSGDCQQEGISSSNLQGGSPSTRGVECHVDQKVLNQILPDLTTNPQCHVMDTLPTVRTMARYEMLRKEVKGSMASRSGRFLNYFEFQGIQLSNDVLLEISSDFL